MIVFAVIHEFPGGSGELLLHLCKTESLARARVATRTELLASRWRDASPTNGDVARWESAEGHALCIAAVELEEA